MEEPVRPAVRVDEKAASLVRARGGHLLIFSAVRRGCCGGSARVPVVEVRRPHDPWRFVTLESGDLRVHVERRLLRGGAGTIRVGASGFGPLRRVWVEGLGDLGERA